jgi:hypothetical protein
MKKFFAQRSRGSRKTAAPVFPPREESADPLAGFRGVMWALTFVSPIWMIAGIIVLRHLSQ